MVVPSWVFRRNHKIHHRAHLTADLSPLHLDRKTGEPVYRFCFVNPRTTTIEIDEIIDALR